MTWQLQEAKQKFSRLVEAALREGPQVVTRHGEAVVVVLPIEEYRRLSRTEPDFKTFLLSAPDMSDLDIERSDEPPREIDL